ncbi:hypothetical protein K466DRAFT_533234 [Polyporus arcularius HHB13444]|uniref:Fungal-type protein kinase domain-containing protein n=1 Tax=Polyporus arcularius HHB13444 TaxID=1314778 RepID=A0A5C3NUD3_9APHY|nr:hypothetical protein K466DRAFT_533234 [Polyporus arcularius HHB13444]
MTTRPTLDPSTAPRQAQPGEQVGLAPDASTAPRQAQPGEQLGHTPVSAKRSSVESLQQPIIATAEELLKRKRQLLDQEMFWLILPLKYWMIHCLPGEEDAPDSIQFPSFVVDMATERTMYPGLEKGFNGILGEIGCAELFTTIATDSKADTSAPGSPGSQDYNPLKPDMVIVPKTKAARAAYEPKPKGKKAASADATDVFGPVTTPASATVPSGPLPSGSSSGHVPVTNAQPDPQRPTDAQPASGETSDVPKEATRSSRMAWAFAEVVMEIKSSDASFPFYAPNGELSTAEKRVQSRGQLAEYGLEVFRRQHRCFLFAIAIVRNKAAFIRFDRNGAVVSQAFDYIPSSRVLGNFFYRLFHVHRNGMSIPRELRGHDPTAELACESCTTLFRDLHKTRKNDFDPVAVAGLEKAATKGWPVYCLSIKSPWSPDGRAVRPDDPVETHRVLVGRPLFSSLSMMGRGTRGFVGWDLDADRPVFVKDSWRTESDRLHSELEIYHQLWSGQESQSVEVTHIPTVLGGGDVSIVTGNGESVQRTHTQKYADDETPRPGRVHSRIVIKEIGRRLKDFEHVYELGRGIYGALQGHQRAYQRKVLHRDISLNNILIVGFGDDCIGLLCDWDLAKTLQQLEDSNPTQAVRSGTWQFMSALLQRYASKQHELSDDLESFTHICTWSTVRYFLKTCAPEVDEEYISRVLQNHFDVGGYYKFKAMLLGEDIAPQMTRTRHPFEGMRMALTNLVKEHYNSLGLTLQPAGQPRKGSKGVMGLKARRRSPSPPSELERDTASFLPEPWATARTTAASGSNTPSTPEVVNLNEDRDTSAQSDAPGKTPATSPLYTHTHFLAIMRHYLHSPGGWDDLEKYSQPLQGVTATSTPAGSRASSGSRRSSEGDINTRPSKQSKYLPAFRLGAHLSDPEEEDEQDAMDVENQSTPKKTHTANFKATHDTRTPSNAGSSKGSRRSGKK